MTRLSRVVGRRRRWIIAVWLVLVLAALPLAKRQTDHLTEGGFVAPRSQSAAVDKALPAFSRSVLPEDAILLESTVRQPAALELAARRVRHAAAGVHGVAIVDGEGPSAFRVGGAEVRAMPVRLTGDWNKRLDGASRLRRALATTSGSLRPVKALLVGDDALWAAAHDVQKQQLAASERVGFPITFLILVLTFGALAAATLPLALGGVAVIMTGAGVYLLSQHFLMSVFVTNASSMIGIGVAVDYSLFVLARYRNEITNGASPDDARRIALQTSGLAVVFSGSTLVLALLAVFVADSAALRSMAAGIIVVVVCAVLGAITLLPALLHAFGQLAYRHGTLRRFLSSAARTVRAKMRRGQGPQRDFWTAWVERVTRRPLVCAIGAAAVMLALAAPALHIRLGNSATDELPSGNAELRGTELVARLMGPGTLAPIYELVTFRDGSVDSLANGAALARHLAALRAVPDVANVMSLGGGGGGAQALVAVIARTSVEAPQTYALVDALRQRARSPSAWAAKAAVGGDSALITDFNALVNDSMPAIALCVGVLGFVILMIMLQSLFLAIKATLMTLLSVISAYGVLVIVFQWSWLNGFLGHHSPGYVFALALPLLLAVTFGLSMDYELFLLLRIREARSEPPHDDRAAIAVGLRSSAGTITGAAVIMVSVFAVFATVGATAVKEIGFGEAAAIALDATLVRLVLVPATMQLVGRWNWWFPTSLQRLMPRLAFEASPPAPIARVQSRPTSAGTRA